MTLPLRRAPRAFLAAVLALAATACEYPTQLPTWDTRWEIPSDSTLLRVDSLLPARIRVSDDRAAFELALDTVRLGQSLGEACATCGLAQGQVIPKPAFALSSSGETALPSDVAEVALTGGTVAISVHNGFGFDPLRPSATARGAMTLQVASGGQPIATLVIDGLDTPFPAGTTLVRQLALPAAAIRGAVTATLSFASPAGDPVVVDTAQRVTLSATISQVQVSSASVRVQSRAVGLDRIDMDLEDVDADIESRVVDGALLLDVANPFGVAGTFVVEIAAPDRTIARTVEVLAGTGTVRIDLAGDELRALLGASPVTLTARGTVSAPGTGFVTVTPSQALRIGSRVRATISSEAP